MKFINYLGSISEVGIYPLISFLIFFSFFVGVTLYAFGTPKKTFDEASSLPLENETVNHETE